MSEDEYFINLMKLDFLTIIRKQEDFEHKKQGGLEKSIQKGMSNKHMHLITQVASDDHILKTQRA